MQEINLVEDDQISGLNTTELQDIQSSLNQQKGKEISSNSDNLKLTLSCSEADSLYSSLLQIVLSHHFQKPEITSLLSESVTSDHSSCFNTVRDTMYKYSKKAEEKFFSCPSHAFLFTLFAAGRHGIDFTREKLFAKVKEGATAAAAAVAVKGEGEGQRVGQREEKVVGQEGEVLGQGQGSKRRVKAARKREEGWAAGEGRGEGKHQLEMNLRIISEMRTLCLESRRQLATGRRGESRAESQLRRKLSNFIEKLIDKQMSEVYQFSEELDMYFKLAEADCSIKKQVSEITKAREPQFQSRKTPIKSQKTKDQDEFQEKKMNMASSKKAQKIHEQLSNSSNHELQTADRYMQEPQRKDGDHSRNMQPYEELNNLNNIIKKTNQMSGTVATQDADKLNLKFRDKKNHGFETETRSDKDDMIHCPKRQQDDHSEKGLDDQKCNINNFDLSSQGQQMFRKTYSYTFQGDNNKKPKLPCQDFEKLSIQNGPKLQRIQSTSESLSKQAQKFFKNHQNSFLINQNNAFAGYGVGSINKPTAKKHLGQQHQITQGKMMMTDQPQDTKFQMYKQQPIKNKYSNNNFPSIESMTPLTPQLQNTFELHLNSGNLATRESRRPTSSSFAMTTDDKVVAATGSISNIKQRERTFSMQRGGSLHETASWPKSHKIDKKSIFSPSKKSLQSFNLHESQEQIIATLIHKNIQLKKTIQRLSKALNKLQGKDDRQTNSQNQPNTNPPASMILNHLNFNTINIHPYFNQTPVAMNGSASAFQPQQSAASPTQLRNDRSRTPHSGARKSPGASCGN